MSYIIYQFTENVAFLADRGVLSQDWLKRKGGSARWWLWSNRAWLVGVSCDFMKLFREAFIERERRVVVRQTCVVKTEAETEKEQEIDRLWWSELFVAGCWLPLCLHYNLQDGLKGVNSGVIGLLGFLAGTQSFMAQWAKTQTT
jgi:Peroxisomal biogenesis factor 11 (PEX11)